MVLYRARKGERYPGFYFIFSPLFVIIFKIRANVQHIKALFACACVCDLHISM